jgi:hypothetical protein
MAGVSCPSCATENEPDALLCVECGADLTDVIHDGGDVRPADPSPAPQAVDACPHCGADVPAAGNQVCVDCLLPLTPTIPPTSALPTPPSRTIHERGPTRGLRLRFGGDTVAVTEGRTALLGRDPGQSPHAALFAALDNVSRRHASVGVAADGAGWVRDENSANGTYVNDRPVPQGGTLPLTDGDVLRLASNVVARVELDRAAAP